MFLFLGLIIYWTGSYYAWGTLGAYGVFLFFQWIFRKTLPHPALAGHPFSKKGNSTKIALLCTGILVLLAL